MIYPLLLILLIIAGYKVSEVYPYWLWKRRVRKISPENCSICCICNDPIYPRQFVGKTADNRLVHAGYHYSLKGESSFCETGAIGIGFWDGKKIAGQITSAAEIACKEMICVTREIGPEGVQTTRW